MNALRNLRKPFRYSYYNVTLVIIGINIAVFVFQGIMPRLTAYLALQVVNVFGAGAYWQVFTYMFTHGNMSHLLFNMLGLFFFGSAVERSLGSKEFLLLYLLSGLFCGVFSLFFYYITGFYYTVLLGASGAIYAILLSYAVINPNARIMLWFILPVPAPILVLAYAIIEIISQLSNSYSGIAHMTHLAGFVFAWFYFILRMGVNPWKRWKQYYR